MNGAGAPDDAALRRLVLQQGEHATSYQIVDAGLQTQWNAGAAVGFVRAGGRRIAAGAPVGAPGDVAAAVAAFEASAATAREPALWFLAEQSLLRAAPWLTARWIAAQPVFAPRELAREFGLHRSLKKQLHRARNHGVAVAEAGPSAPPEPLQRCLRQWLATRRAPPLRLLAGPLAIPDLRDRRLFVARRAGAVVAYLLAAPIPRRRGWLIEQIVRGEGACNGTAESLLHAAVQALAAEDAAMLTLGCSPLSMRSGTRPPRDRWTDALSFVRRAGRPVYDFEGVDAWKGKFRCAHWEPLWLAASPRAPGLRDLLALARACAGGSVAAFLLRSLLRRRPRLRRRIGPGAR